MAGEFVGSVHPGVALRSRASLPGVHTTFGTSVRLLRHSCLVYSLQAQTHSQWSMISSEGLEDVGWWTLDIARLHWLFLINRHSSDSSLKFERHESSTKDTGTREYLDT